MPGSVVSGIFGSKSADKAASAAEKGAALQAQAQEKAIEEQRRQFDYTQGILKPYQGVGYNALYAMADMMGLPRGFGSKEGFTDFSTGGLAGMAGAGGPLTEDQIRQNLIASGEYNLAGEEENIIYDPDRGTWVDLRGVGGFGQGALGKLTGSTQYKELNQKERDTARRSWELYKAREEGLGRTASLEEWYRVPRYDETWTGGMQIGYGGGPSLGLDEEALNQAIQDQLAQQGAAGGAAGAGATGEDGVGAAYDWMQSPAYQFRLNEGLRALSRAAGATGGRISGARMLGMQEYGQQSAAQEFGAQYNRMAGLAGFGVGATNVAAGQSQATGANISNLLAQQGSALGAGATQAGQYQAAGTLNLGTALGGGLNTLTSGGSLSNLFGGSTSDPFSGRSQTIDQAFSAGGLLA